MQNQTTFVVTIPSIEIDSFTKFSDFTPQTLPTVARALTNAQNFIRYRQVINQISSFASVVSSSADFYAKPSTAVFPSSAPSTIDLEFTFNKLEPVLALYMDAMGTTSSGTASTTVYSASDISKAGAVIKTIVYNALTAGPITEKQFVVKEQSELKYVVGAPIQINNVANVRSVILADVTAPVLVTPSIVITAK